MDPAATPSLTKLSSGSARRTPRPGVTRSQAQAEFNILEHQEDRLHPGRNTAVVTTDGTWLEEFELNMSGRDLMLMTFFSAPSSSS